MVEDKIFNGFFRGKKVLVTGHTGFKGSWLSAWLVKLGAQVSGLSLDPLQENDHYNLLNLNEKMNSHIGDIRDYNFVQEVFDKEQPEIILHLAAQALVIPAYTDPKSTFEINFNGGLNVLEASRKSDSLKSLVYITSDKCYKNKEWEWGYRESDELGGYDPYSGSKGAAELVFYSYNESYLKAKGIRAASTRAGNVIGGGDWSEARIVPDLAKALGSDQQLELRSPFATRPWQHVLEPIRGYLFTAKALFEEKGEEFSGSYNFGPSIENNVTVQALVERGYEIWGKQYNFSKENTDRLSQFKECNLLFLNCDKAFQYLNWSPVLNFEQTMDFTINWYKEYQNTPDKVKDITNSQIERFEKLSVQK